MGYGDFKDLPRGTTSKKILRDKAFNIAKNTKYNVYQKGLPSMFYNVFDKNSPGGGSKKKNENMLDQQLAEELHKPIIIKFKKRKVHLSFSENIWGWCSWYAINK